MTDPRSPGEIQVLACISCSHLAVAVAPPVMCVKNSPLPPEVMLSPGVPNLNPGKLILTLMCYVTFQILAQVTLYVGAISLAHPSPRQSPTRGSKLEILGCSGQGAFKALKPSR